MRLWVLFAVLLFSSLSPAAAVAQISPGPLSRSHASLEGMLQCSKCHTFGLGRQELKCASCHVEIMDRVRTNQGYHARIVDGSKANADCATCHAEHVGADFELIRWPAPGRSGFDHTQAGYKLEGKHSTLQCSQCHNAKKITAARKTGILMKDLDRTFLGLGTDCLSCHSDAHRGQLGSDCKSCHSQDAWKPVTQFDHRRTRFPLTGLHSAVSCQQCHGPTSRDPVVRYTSLNFADCTGCHRDPHRGAFTASCTQCHSTAGWKVSKTTLTSNFDHSRTRYPLVGKHSAVECSSCHKSSNFRDRLASGLCLDCHKDKHDGQFAKRTDKGDCASCHTLDGFERSTFDVRAHGSSQYARYALTGKHAAVECKECHEKKGSFVNYHPKFESCTNCHKDTHAGQFAARYADKCETCHVVDGFLPATFTLARHRETRFTLAGAHVAVACADCHRRSRDQDPHRYAFEDRSCTGCHRDPHQLAAESRQCETCHTLNVWIPARAFDHNTTRFPLLGAHRATECLLCHKATESVAGKELPFTGAPQQCSGCHEDIHAGQFAERFGIDDCSSCHSTARWKPSGFDHARSAFPLDGAHQNVKCVECHDRTSRVSGREVLVYQEAPTECAKCH